MGINRVEGMCHVEARITSDTGAHIASIAVYRSASLDDTMRWRDSFAANWAQHGEIGIPAVDRFLHAMRAGNAITFHAGA